MNFLIDLRMWTKIRSFKIYNLLFSKKWYEVNFKNTSYLRRYPRVVYLEVISNCGKIFTVKLVIGITIHIQVLS